MTAGVNENRCVKPKMRDRDRDRAIGPVEGNVAVALDPLCNAQVSAAGGDEMSGGAVRVRTDEVRRKHASE